MPYYLYHCNSCQHEWEELRKISEMKLPLDGECPKCEASGNIEQRVNGCPAFGDSMRLGLKKPDQGFTDLMNRIHHRTPGSQLDKTSTFANVNGKFQP